MLDRSAKFVDVIRSSVISHGCDRRRWAFSTAVSKTNLFVCNERSRRRAAGHTIDEAGKSTFNEI